MQQSRSFDTFIPAFQAADLLWKAYLRLDPGRPSAQSWDDAISNPRARAMIEDISVKTCSAVALALLFLAFSIYRHAGPTYIELLILGFAVAAGICGWTFSLDRVGHPVARLLDRIVALQALDERVARIMMHFAADYPLWTSKDGETPSGDAPVAGAQLLPRHGCLLMHSQLSVRRLAARRLGDRGLEKLVVQRLPLEEYAATIRPIRSYVDLLGADEWVISRAERASLRDAQHGMHREIRGYFIIIRELNRQVDIEENNKRRLDRVQKVIRESNLPIDMAATRFSQFINGSHKFSHLFRSF